jgi:hypothetical protein
MQDAKAHRDPWDHLVLWDQLEQKEKLDNLDLEGQLVNLDHEVKMEREVP